MKPLRLIITLLIFSMFSTVSFAQNNKGKTQGNFPEFKKTWSFGFGANLLYDTGREFADFEFSKDVNYSTPFYFNVDYNFSRLIGASFIFSRNSFTEGKRIEGGYIADGSRAGYYALDVVAKIYLKGIFNINKFDPYILGGIGYTNIGKHFVTTSLNSEEGIKTGIPTVGHANVNAGLGVNYWFSKNWGANISAIGKWSLEEPKPKWDVTGTTNQAQFFIGVVYMIEK